MRAKKALGGRVWISNQFIDCSILIGDGKIIDIIPKSNVPANLLNRDFEDRWILPGLIDVHVHLRDFAESNEEDFKSGTKAAVAGGFTTVLSMPNTIPPIKDLKSLNYAYNRASKNIWCNVGFHLGFNEDIGEIKKGILNGAFSIKFYPRDLAFVCNRRDLIQALKQIPALIYIHAEDLNMIEENRSLFNADLEGVEMHGKIRNSKAEVKAIETALTELNGLELHFAHISTSEGANMLRGLMNTTFEVTVHHLTLTEEIISRVGRIAKVNPPLRSKRDVEHLRECVNRGFVNAIVSDHAPHLPVEKECKDYDEIPSGFPGLETSVGVLIDLVKRGELELTNLINCLTWKPAQRFGLIRKGSIAPGMDADLTVIDQKIKWTVRASEFFTKSKLSPFDGEELTGKVIATMVGGNWAFDNGHPKEASGRVLRKKWT